MLLFFFPNHSCKLFSDLTLLVWRSEEHTSELQSQSNLVCRLLLEKKNVPLSRDDAQRLVAFWLDHYNTVRLHSSIGYLEPMDKLEVYSCQFFAEAYRTIAEACSNG